MTATITTGTATASTSTATTSTPTTSTPTTSTATTSTVLRGRCGAVVPLDIEQWRRPADAVEMAALAAVEGPAIDVGCGPGRIVAALAASGRVAMGVDTSPTASAEACRRGAAVLTRSIFDPLPGERRWKSVVMLDGNIGIGGDPLALLRRAAELLAPGGRVLVEVGEPGSATGQLTVRVEHGDHYGPWFPWARVSVDEIDSHFVAAGLEADWTRQVGERWFASACSPATGTVPLP